MEEKKDYFWPFAVVATIAALVATIYFTKRGKETVPAAPKA